MNNEQIQRIHEKLTERITAWRLSGARRTASAEAQDCITFVLDEMSLLGAEPKVSTNCTATPSRLPCMYEPTDVWVKHTKPEGGQMKGFYTVYCPGPDPHMDYEIVAAMLAAGAAAKPKPEGEKP